MFAGLTRREKLIVWAMGVYLAVFWVAFLFGLKLVFG